MKNHVTIIGAGPAGLGFARSLANTGLQVVIIEKQSAADLEAPAFDGRDIALTHRSVRIMKELGAWSRIDADAIGSIRQAKVFDGTSQYFLNFERRKETTEPLGYIISNHLIRKALYEEVETVANVEIITDAAVISVKTNDNKAIVALSNGETIESALVVAADSRFSETRRMMGISAAMHDFGRVAIVCRMAHDEPHHEVAFECFHYGRTLAVLPLSGDESSIVITAPTDVANTIVEMTEEQFAADVQSRFEHRLGKMKLVSELHSYPLVAVHADQFVATRFALIGDAAVGMHPVTAHGFNLGLGGQDILATQIKHALSHGQDIGGSSLLHKYESKHMRISRPLYVGTNEIVNFFTDDRIPVKILRHLALRVANNLEPIKSIIKNKLTEADDSGTLLPRLF